MAKMVAGSRKPELKQCNVSLQLKGLLEQMASARNVLQSQFQEIQDGISSDWNSLRTRIKQVEDREKELEAKVVKFNSEMESKAEELRKIERLAEEKRKEVDGKEKRLLEVEKCIELKRRQLEGTNQAPAEINVPVKVEQPESSHVGNVASLTSPNLSRSGNQSVHNVMLAVLQMSTDPAKLILKLMQESFSARWGKGYVGFEESFVKNNISLLNDLMKVKPDVGSIVKEDALRLAVQWQAKMRADTENSLEILSFLQFIAAYGLLSTLNGDDIVKLLGVVCQQKQAPELCQTLDFADKMLPDVVQSLIERKQLIDAVKCICAFKLIDKFSPTLLLKEYVEDARKSYCTIWLEEESLDEKDEVLGNQIAELRAVIRYIEAHNLESEFPSKDIEPEIVKLEKLKENSSSSAPSVVSKVEQEHDKGKRKSSHLSIKIERELRKSKRLRQMKEEI